MQALSQRKLSLSKQVAKDSILKAAKNGKTNPDPK